MELKIINYVLESIKNTNGAEDVKLFIRELEIFKAFLDKLPSYRWDEVVKVFCGGEEDA